MHKIPMHRCNYAIKYEKTELNIQMHASVEYLKSALLRLHVSKKK